MPVKTSPMDSERPKTPSWAFTAPDLVKNSSSYACCHFFPFQALLQARHSAPVEKTEPSSERFRVHKPSTRASRKWCKLSNS
jgi:hypothetical protein